MQYNQSHAKYVFIEVWNNLIKITATRLERGRGATHRGFESPSARHFTTHYLMIQLNSHNDYYTIVSRFAPRQYTLTSSLTI